METDEKTLSEETVFTGKIFTVKKRQVITPGGTVRDRELVVHPGGAGILALDEDKNVYMIRQFRAPFGCRVTEIPAGKLEKGEDPLLRAKRELREETGLSAENFIFAGEFWPTVGFCDERIYLYIATGLSSGQTDFDEDEYIETFKMPFRQVYKMCLDGSIKDGKTLAAVMKAKALLGL